MTLTLVAYLNAALIVHLYKPSMVGFCPKCGILPTLSTLIVYQPTSTFVINLFPDFYHSYSIGINWMPQQRSHWLWFTHGIMQYFTESLLGYGHVISTISSALLTGLHIAQIRHSLDKWDHFRVIFLGHIGYSRTRVKPHFIHKTRRNSLRKLILVVMRNKPRQDAFRKLGCWYSFDGFHMYA